MEWFNYIGLILICVIMVPNIICSIKQPDSFINKVNNKLILTLEQIGRYGCFVLMIFNIPFTYFGFWFDYGLTLYIVVNSILILSYIFFWIICWKKHKLLRAYALSIIPSIVFLFSGIVLLSIPLISCSVVFSICHISVSLLNAYSSL